VVSRDHLGHGVNLEPKALLALKDQLELTVPLVSRETMVHQDQLVSLAPEVTLVQLEDQDCQDLAVHRDSQDLLDNQALLVHLGVQALRVKSDLGDLMERLDQRVKEETPGLLDNLVLQAQLGL
jgi:hypothetical protein